MRVTKDAFEYAEWPSRKPSKKKIQRAALRADPIGTTAQVLAEAGKRSVSRTVERLGGRSVRAALVQGKSLAATALPALGAVGALAAAGILGGWLMDKATDSVGDKINRISLAFVDAQRELIRRTGVSSWGQVPEAPRTKLLNEYKAALARVAANPGLARFEKTPTFGR